MLVLVTAYFCKPWSQVPFSLGTLSSKFTNIKPWLNSAWKSMNLGAPWGLMPSVSCATGVLVLQGQVSEGWRELSGWCCLDEGSGNKGTVNSSCSHFLSSVRRSPTRNREKISSPGPCQASLILCFPGDSQPTKSSTCFVTNWMVLAVCTEKLHLQMAVFWWCPSHLPPESRQIILPA